MNILFISHWDKKKESNIGIKLHGQVNALQNLGHDVTALKFQNGSVWAETKLEKIKLFDVPENGFAHLLAIPKAVRCLLKQSPYQYDICYIRRIFCTPWHLMMLRNLKKDGIVTVEELPTYPYDTGVKFYAKNLFYKIALVIEKICRQFYRFWLDWFVIFGSQEKIWGVPTIRIENGFDINCVPLGKRIFKGREHIDILTISSMKPWHGYERLLEGLALYKDKYPEKAGRFKIHMVGEGEMKEEWEKLSATLNLNEDVIFYGNKIGEELDLITQKCAIAIASLGFYKIYQDGEIGSSFLKIREYMGRGIPFVYCLEEPLIKGNEDFCMLISNNSEPIDFEKIEKFFYNLVICEENGKNIPEEMRIFAKKNYTWTSQMGKVIKMIEGK